MRALICNCIRYERNLFDGPNGTLKGGYSVSTGDGRWFAVKEYQQPLIKEVSTCEELVFITFDVNENDEATIDVMDANLREASGL